MNPTLLDGFDRICIINLPQRADRRRAVTRELQRHGVTVDGARVRFFAAIRPDGPGDFPSTGARGCYLSHLQVLQQARADGVRRLLVLEDDVMFSAEMAKAHALSDGLARGTWHLAYPGHVQPTLPGLLRWQTTQEPLVCAHCYAVNGPALNTVVNYLEACLARPAGHPLGGAMHVDGALTLLRRQQPGLITLRASRSLAGQRSSRSDIIGPSWLDRLPVAALLRAARNRWRRLAGAV
jgi:glycosyl transferase, family 25